MAIVAVIGVMALTGLNQVIAQQTATRERAQRWQDIQLAMRVVVQDLAQMHPRPTRDETSESYQPTLLAEPSAQFALEFSRGGWANPAGFARGTQDRSTTPFGSTITGSLSNGAREGVAEVFDMYANRTLRIDGGRFSDTKGVPA